MNPSTGFISGRVWAVISNSIVVQDNRVYVGGRREGEVKSSMLLRSKTFWEWKISNRCRRETKFEQSERRIKGKKVTHLVDK
jgi:hypothetical protein